MSKFYSYYFLEKILLATDAYGLTSLTAMEFRDALKAFRFPSYITSSDKLNEFKFIRNGKEEIVKIGEEGSVEKLKAYLKECIEMSETLKALIPKDKRIKPSKDHPKNIVSELFDQIIKEEEK